MAGNVVVVDAPKRHRYEVSVAGEVVGFALYQLRPDRVIFIHTEVDEAHQGAGIASQLVRAALDDVRHRGLAVVPLCPYIDAWIQSHPTYADLVSPGLVD